MNRAEDHPVSLFAYGTLQIPEVLRAVTGRTFPGIPAILEGFRRGRLVNATYPGLVRAPGFRTGGALLLGLDQEILTRLDRFEGKTYRREAVEVLTGSVKPVSAFTYVMTTGHPELSGEPWDLERFCREDLAGFLRGYAGFEE